MIIVADASVLVAELLRKRGRELLAHPELRVVVAEEQWDETGHELGRRLEAMVDQNRITRDHAGLLRETVDSLQTGILTGDHDFLGCGCPTWTVQPYVRPWHGGNVKRLRVNPKSTHRSSSNVEVHCHGPRSRSHHNRHAFPMVEWRSTIYFPQSVRAG